MKQRFKAVSSLSWEFEAESSDAVRIAKSKLQNIVLPEGVKFTLKVEPKKDNDKIILGEIDPNEVLSCVSKENKKEYLGYKIKMGSSRYFVFRDSRNCVACGLEGTKMLLERHLNDNNPHFNLYGIEDDSLVLMTKDHIRAKSCGGGDHHSNYQTMCCICNNIKGNDNLLLEDIAYLRKLYNDNKLGITKKKLNSLINTEKNRLRKERSESRSLGIGIFTNADLFVVRRDFLLAISVYDTNVDGVLACIKKETKLDVEEIDEKQAVVRINDEKCIIYTGFLIRL